MGNLVTACAAVTRGCCTSCTRLLRRSGCHKKLKVDAEREQGTEDECAWLLAESVDVCAHV